MALAVAGYALAPPFLSMPVPSQVPIPHPFGYLPDTPVEVLRSTNRNDSVGICQARENADPRKKPSDAAPNVHSLLGRSYSFEFSNCARTAIMVRVSEDVAESRVGKSVR